MVDFNAARKNMVDCQIHTSGVITPSVLNAFSSVPREKFVAANFAGIAYSDYAVPVSNGRFLMDPITHARMLEFAQPQASDRVLDVGGSTGYSAAILARIASEVVALEECSECLIKAQELWKSMNLSNIVPVKGTFNEGSLEHEPFDLIFINGSINVAPIKLLAQLSDGGKLIAIIRNTDEVMGRVTMYIKTGESCSSYPLFESGCPYLPGHDQVSAFSF